MRGRPKAGRANDSKLKSPKAILDLEVRDKAMVSSAWCYLPLARRAAGGSMGERGNQHAGKVLNTPDGEFSVDSPAERLVSVDINERIAIARRAVVNRCLYGVDINLIKELETKNLLD